MIDNVKTKQFIKTAILLCGVLGCFFLIKNNTTLLQSSTNTETEILYSEKYDGFAQHTKISKVIFSPTTTATATATEEKLFIQNPQNPSYSPLDQKMLHSSAIYDVNYKIQESGHHIIDLSLSINKENKMAVLNLKGLMNKEKISLKINDQAIHTATPVDWSGKINLRASLDSFSTENAEICAYISQKDNPDRSICHVVQNGEAA